MAANSLKICSFSSISNKHTNVSIKAYTTRCAFFQSQKIRPQSIQLQKRPSRFRISCAAKPETVDKVREIVKRQLALPDSSPITPESKFSALGADSLDTVEIVMGLEEEFGISVGEDNAQAIVTIQDAADLIEDLVEKIEK